uniref:DNA polymerase n=1 Tax=Pappia fissilis TaxID=1040649 RepID=UPI002A80A7E1|nr:DNA polymerase [Pappia fissilis]WOX61285.1 DNA polymerase [Pappia fissilis]
MFNEYIEHFYEIKKNNSTGPLRFISKNHLNFIYGYFGRLKNILETITILNKDIEFYLITKVVKNIIKIDDEKSVLLTVQNLDNDIIKELNSTIETELTTKFVDVKNNVAIASAVTSYARIHMIPFKNNDEICYTDTDSIFTTKKLADHLIGEALSLMKDEIKGLIIEEAYFLDINKYGYWYYDKTGQCIEKSVIAGVDRNSLTFKEIESLANSNIITKTMKNIFYKNLNNLQIEIKDINITISNTPSKECINNRYIPLNIYDLDHKFYTATFVTKLKNKIFQWFNKISMK